MIVKTVKQFVCEFCGKKQYALGAMRRHERHCTANPGRECRMCALTPDGCSAAHLPKLVAMLADEEELPRERMRKVREATDCPACTLAAIRQSRIWEKYIAEPCDMDTGEDHSMHRSFFWLPPVSDSHGKEEFLGFDYKAEKAQMLREYRENEMSPYGY
jgi:hypothetical protein